MYFASYLYIYKVFVWVWVNKGMYYSIYTVCLVLVNYVSLFLFKLYEVSFLIASLNSAKSYYHNLKSKVSKFVIMHCEDELSVSSVVKFEL